MFFRNLPQANQKEKRSIAVDPGGGGGRESAPSAVGSPLADFEGARGKAVLPAVLIVLGVEHPVSVLLRGDVLLPLLVAVRVLPTQPAVIAGLRTDTKETDRRRFSHSVNAVKSR